MTNIKLSFMMTPKISILLILTLMMLGCKNDPPTKVEESITINEEKAPLMGIDLMVEPTENDHNNYIEVSADQEIVFKYNGIEKDQVTWYVDGTRLSSNADLTASYHGSESGIKEIKAVLSSGEEQIAYIMVVANPDPKKDSDGDGILDSVDKCPNEQGTKQNNGCPLPPAPTTVPSPTVVNPRPRVSPDRDGDGIPDTTDKCPDVKGNFANSGCPLVAKKDSDGDGILDSVDKCPDEKGTKQYNGCPPPPVLAVQDRDGDGIPDKDDKCPDEKGTKEYNGCLPPPLFIAKSSPSVCGLTSQAALDDEKVTTGSGSISIKPSQDLILFEAKLVANGYGKIDISIEGGDIKKEISITKTLILGYNTIRVNDFKNTVLRAGKTYTLMYQTQGDVQVTLIKNAYSSNCSDSKISMTGKNIFYDVVYKY